MSSQEGFISLKYKYLDWILKSIKHISQLFNFQKIFSVSFSFYFQKQ